MGESQRSKSASNLYSQVGQYNPEQQMGNVYSSYKPEFTTNDLLTRLRDINTGQRQQTIQQGADMAARAGEGSAARLASEGITGGSLYNQGVAQAQDTANQQTSQALGQLGQGAQANELGLMQSQNQQGLNLATLDQQQKNAIANAIMSKYGIQGNLLGNLDTSTTAGNIMSGLGGLTALGANVAIGGGAQGFGFWGGK